MGWLGGSFTIEQSLHHGDADEQKINEKQSKMKV
jgi:hypothetical protein